MIRDDKNFSQFEQSFGKWIKKSQNCSKTVNINTCIPMQRKSILTVISSSESLINDNDDCFSDNQWMAVISTKDHKNQFKKNIDVIKTNIIKRGTPKNM